MWDQKKYREAHLSLYAKLQKQWRQNNPRKALLINAKAKARARGLEFSVLEGDVEWSTYCPVLGIELNYQANETGRAGERRQNKATLDRRDNTKGYVRGNVFVISHRANRIKSDATNEELRAIAEYAGQLQDSAHGSKSHDGGGFD